MLISSGEYISEEKGRCSVEMILSLSAQQQQRMVDQLHCSTHVCHVPIARIISDHSGFIVLIL